MELPGTIRTDGGFTVEGASPSMLSGLLDAYDFEMRKQNRDIWSGFKVGLGRAEIVDRLGEVGLVPPEELIVWWSWKNGFDESVNPPLSLPQMSLDYSLDLREEDDLGEGLGQWNPAWLRVAGYSDQDAMSAKCDGDGPVFVRATPEPSTGIRIDDPSRQVVSLCTPVTWWLLGIAKGWSHWDGKFWAIDQSQFPYEWQLTELLT